MTKRGKKMLYWGVGILALLIMAWAGYTYFYEGNLGQPDYAVLTQEGDVEFRKYEPFLIASTQTQGKGRPGLSSGFRVLADYIFGGNKPGESLAMTTPVLQQDAPGESLPMTAPVIQNPDKMRMAFVMPAGRTLEDLPIPNNAQISLTTVDWGHVAALRFSGRGKQETFRQVEKELRAVLKAQGRTATGPALYAQYNSPSAFPPLRRNEVIIPIAAQ